MPDDAHPVPGNGAAAFGAGPGAAGVPVNDEMGEDG